MMNEEQYQQWVVWLQEHGINMKNRAIVLRFDLMQRACVTLTSEYGWFTPTTKSTDLEMAEDVLFWCFLNFIKAEDKEIINHKWEEWATLVCEKAISSVMTNEIDPKETYDVVKRRTMAAFQWYLTKTYELYDEVKSEEIETEEDIITPLLQDL